MQSMLIGLILAAVLATDVAVATLYFSLRPRKRGKPPAAVDHAATREIEELVVRLRRQVEQASAEIGRQRAQLRRLLAGVEYAEPLARQPGQGVVADTPVVAPERVLALADQGLPPRAIAEQTRVSVEEVRLLLAMAEGRERRASA